MMVWREVTHRIASGRTAPAAMNEVTAVFDDGTTVIFPIPVAATVADLAQRLTTDGGLPRRRMLSVIVRLSGKTTPLAVMPKDGAPSLTQ